MDINDIQKIAHNHNLQEIKQIKEKYSSNLKLLFQMIDSKIIEETRKGEDNAIFNNHDLEKMLNDCNIASDKLDDIGISNWKHVISHFYRKNGFNISILPSSIGIYWDEDDDGTLDEDIDHIFGTNKPETLDADEIDLDKPEEDTLEEVDENSGGYVNMENSDEDESNKVNPAFIETSKQIHNLNEDESNKTDE